MKTSRSLGLVSLVAVTMVAPAASAELSERSKSIVWNVDKWIYMDKCRFDKGLPSSVGSDYVYECERSYQEEEKALSALSAEDKKDPKAGAALEKHKKSADFVQKAKAAKQSQDGQKANLDEARQKFREHAAAQKEGLWFIHQLDKKQDSYIKQDIAIGELEKKVDAALAMKDFAARCASTYNAIDFKGAGGGDELWDRPANACPLAQNREAIMKRELPRWFAEMRKGLDAASAEATGKINRGDRVWAREVECAKNPATCGGAEKTIASIAGKLAIPPGEPAKTTNPAFEPAMKKATSERRIGKFRDGVREGVVAAALKQRGVKFLATAVYRPDDEITKNSLGIPQHRSRLVGVLVKKDSETFCRAFQVFASADHEGGGRYGAFFSGPFDVERDTFVVSACK